MWDRGEEPVMENSGFSRWHSLLWLRALPVLGMMCSAWLRQSWANVLKKQRKKTVKKKSSKYGAGTSAGINYLVYWFQCSCIGLQQGAPACCQHRLTAAVVLSVWDAKTSSDCRARIQEANKQAPKLNCMSQSNLISKGFQICLYKF